MLSQMLGIDEEQFSAIGGAVQRAADAILDVRALLIIQTFGDNPSNPEEAILVDEAKDQLFGEAENAGPAEQ